MYPATERTHNAGFYLRLAFVTAIWFVLAGCAATNKTSDERGPAKCPPRVGQSETEFLRCGCFWDNYSPTPNVRLLSETQTSSGVTRVYSCQDLGAYSFTVTVVNGTVSDLKGPSR